ADIVRPTDCLDRASGLRFPQDPNYLFFAESTPLHLLLLFEQNFSYVTSPFWGSGHRRCYFPRDAESRKVALYGPRTSWDSDSEPNSVSVSETEMSGAGSRALALRSLTDVCNLKNYADDSPIPSAQNGNTPAPLPAKATYHSSSRESSRSFSARIRSPYRAES